MGRPRKSLEHHEATGATRKNPGRFKERHEVTESLMPLGDPPEHFMQQTTWGEAHRKLWFELQAIAPPGALSLSDRWWVEEACQLKYKARREIIRPGERTLLSRHMSKLYMSPEDRSRGVVKRAKEADKQNQWGARAEQRLSGPRSTQRPN